MNIGIMSDSHKNLNQVERAVQMAEARYPIDLWLHAGDCSPDGKYLETITKAKVVVVMGNCDQIHLPIHATEVVEAGGHRILLTHGYLEGINFGYRGLLKKARRLKTDIVVYGHTHVGSIEQMENVLLLNPGSISRPRDGKPPSFMVLHIDKKDVQAEFLYLTDEA